MCEIHINNVSSKTDYYNTAGYSMILKNWLTISGIWVTEESIFFNYFLTIFSGFQKESNRLNHDENNSLHPKVYESFYWF